MIRWLLFFIVWLIYVLLFYFFAIGLPVIIGLGFFQNTPAVLSKIARVFIFPTSIVGNAFSFITGKELYHLVSVSFAGVLVSSLVCLTIYGVKLLRKRVK